MVGVAAVSSSFSSLLLQAVLLLVLVVSLLLQLSNTIIVIPVVDGFCVIHHTNHRSVDVVVEPPLQQLPPSPRCRRHLHQERYYCSHHLQRQQHQHHQQQALQRAALSDDTTTSSSPITPATILHNIATVLDNDDIDDKDAAAAIRNVATTWDKALFGDGSDGECDWYDITVAMENAIPAFASSLSSLSSSKYGGVMAEQFQDMSTIEGCMSIGPPSSIPNWIEIQTVFVKLAEQEQEQEQQQEEESDGDDENRSSTAFRQIANELEKLIEIL